MCSPLLGGHLLHASDLRGPLISGLGRIKVSKPLATREDLLFITPGLGTPGRAKVRVGVPAK
jgi:hypothetical protein